MDKDTRIILFYASREEARRIFSAANELNMTGREYQLVWQSSQENSFNKEYLLI